MDTAAEKSYRDFVSAHWHGLVRTAYLIVGDRGYAEDLAQTALVRLHGRWRRVEKPELYARTVVVNLARSHWRRVLRRRENPAGTVTGALADDRVVDDPADRHDQRDELWRALSTLPTRMRAVLVLRYFEDLSEADTARVLDCSIGTVKSQASRGLDRLRVALEQIDAPYEEGVAL
ncbi:MAG TPA: SigE family RNA polymerase sigma factor [Actinopolymorphaceae bacterium]